MSHHELATQGEGTHDAKVARTIYPEARVDDTAVLTREHSCCTDGVVHAAAVLPHVVLKRPAPASNGLPWRRGGRADVWPQGRCHEQRESALEDSDAQRKVSGVREVIRVDARRREGVGGANVYGASRKWVLQCTKERGVSFSRLGGWGIGYGLAASPLQISIGRVS